MATTAKKKSAKRKSALPKNAQKWVKALRSGKYKNTQSQLREEDKFCCLGVACDVAKKDLGIDWHGEDFDGEHAVLTDKVQGWLGVASATGFIPSLGRSLTGINDSGKTFKQIATIIEKHAHELFVKEGA